MKPIAFAIVIISRALFLWFAGDERIFTHPLSGHRVSLEAFIWQIGNFVPIIALGFMSIFGDRTWTITTIAFTVLAFCDYLDWIFRGNHVWWFNDMIPVSMNTLTGFVFALTFMYEYMKYGKSGWLKN